MNQKKPNHPTLIAVFIILTLGLTGRSFSAQMIDAHVHLEKIKFRLDNIRADGLRGPPDGLVAVTYEFCLPANDQVYQEVRRINPNIELYHGSMGRIGCSVLTQTLSRGSTGEPQWKKQLLELTKLPYITEIRESFFE